jgi:hypothetical protein
MSESILSDLESNNVRYSITLNSEDILLLISQIREMVKKEIHLEYKRKLSEEYLTREELLVMFKITKSVLNKWNRNDFLVPVKVGGKSLYRKSDVMRIVSKKKEETPTREQTRRMA